jgi:hypothetical protein
MTPPRVIFALAPVALAVLAGGCGPSASEKADIARAEAIVRRFAESSDANACKLLTNNAVTALYGKFVAPPRVARANCARRSVRFKGEPVTITRTELLDPGTIKVNALSADKKFSFQVNLVKRRGTWRIDLISQAKVVS